MKIFYGRYSYDELELSSMEGILLRIVCYGISFLLIYLFMLVLPSERKSYSYLAPSKYGRCVYIYPDADLRLYPGILRGCPEWNDLYARRTAVERSIGSFKYVLGVEQRKTFNSLTTKADLFLAGIVQLLSVVLADVLHERQLFRRIRRLSA